MYTVLLPPGVNQVAVNKYVKYQNIKQVDVMVQKQSCFNRSGLHWCFLVPPRFASGWDYCLYYETFGRYMAMYIYCTASGLQHLVDVLTGTAFRRNRLLQRSLVYTGWKCKQ